MNFGTLLKFEFKKTFSQKAYWLALIIMLAILLANELFPIFLGNYRPRIERERALSGTVVNEETIQKIVTAENPHDYDPIYEFLKYTTGSTDISDLNEESLYSIRMQVNEGLMDDDKATDKEKEYWRKLDTGNQTPFTYTYDGAYTAFFEIVYMMNFMILILCGIALSGLFADERAKGCDQIIFATRLGKTTLLWSKITMGAICGLITSLILLIFQWTLAFILYGFDGWNAMFQLHVPSCMMVLTSGQAALYASIMLIICGIFLGVIAMFLSQITMNHPAAMATMVFMLFLSMFNPGTNIRIIRILFDLMPGAYVGSWLFYNYRTITIFGLHLNVMQYTVIFWALISVLLVFIIKNRYKNYQVK